MRCGLATWIVVGVAAVSAGGCCSVQGRLALARDSPGRKYAVLASVGDPTIDGEAYHSEFWYDTVMVYRALITLDYAPEDVFVLFANGTDFGSALPGYEASYPPIVDYPLNLPLTVAGAQTAKNNIAHVLCCLATGCVSRLEGTTCTCSRFSGNSPDGISCATLPRLRPKDSLLVWLRGHGETNNCENTRMKFDDGRYLRDTELAGLLSRFETKHRVLAIDTCRAGGFLDDVASDRDEHLRGTVAMASTGEPHMESGGTDPFLCNQGSYKGDYDENGTMVIHGRFSYWLNQALTGATTADVDGNALASTSEAFEFVRNEVERENLSYGNQMNPGMRDHAGLAPCTFLDMPRPGADVELYFRSTGTSQSQCPDLDISPGETATSLQGTPAQQPAFTLRATVHNAGCSPATNATVTFFARPQGVSDGPFDQIGDPVTLEGIRRGASRVASLAWRPLGPGKYVVEARVLAAGDASPAESRGTPDANVCRATVTVDRPRN